MSISHETQQRVNQFAKEQSRYYLDAAEMTYMEKLRRKTDSTKRKINTRLARFKGSSGQAIDAQNDLILYMSDYISDLVAKGVSEQEAYEKAEDELAATGDSDFHSTIQERYRQYYENYDPASLETAGLLYGGFVTLGMVIGALAAYILGGGRQEFLNGGWIDTLIGAGAGILLGAGLGQISHAIIASIKRR